IVTCNYGYNIVTFKYNSVGARLWKKSYTGISGEYYDEVTGIAIDPANNIYLTGSSVRTTGQEDFLTIKYDASGNQLWDRFYNGTGNDGDYAKGIAVDAGGNAYVTGRVYDIPFDVNFMTIKYDTDGVQKWKVSYDGGNNHNDDEAVVVCLDPSGDVIVTGIGNRPATVDDYATIKYSQSVSIKQISSSTPEKFSLSQNYPNPFNPKTVISYRLAVGSTVSLKVYNMLGNVISVLINEYQHTGAYEVDFDAGDIPSGIYFYKLTANEFSETKKMNLIK
ncbi:MAG: T9SS type A sorting domain-containing protein, partial [Bacteroidota bacterium]|nr:T9SS type A sorting domain-containing protein [Bacteroidota bacterium]